jgi:hypothetical protein
VATSGAAAIGPRARSRRAANGALPEAAQRLLEPVAGADDRDRGACACQPKQCARCGRRPATGVRRRVDSDEPGKPADRAPRDERVRDGVGPGRDDDELRDGAERPARGGELAKRRRLLRLDRRQRVEGRIPVATKALDAVDPGLHGGDDEQGPP